MWESVRQKLGHTSTKVRGILKGKCVVFFRKARAAQKYALRTENSHFHEKKQINSFQIYVRATVHTCTISRVFYHKFAHYVIQKKT